jgi:hypothetical protein
MFCHASLGRNDAIEHFPVGRRLAFDADKGRLWVVCGACERWNLTPLEERWEAVEECERSFRGTRLRVSTDNIGMARLREGTTLVRIGQPQRPELAAWRYGDQFGRRRRRDVMMSTAGLAAVAGLAIAAPLGLGIVGGGIAGGAALLPIHVFNLVRAFRLVGRVSVSNQWYSVNQYKLNQVALRPNDESGFELYVPFMQPLRTRMVKSFAHRGQGTLQEDPLSVTLTGDQALSAARTLLPRINAGGGTDRSVREAVDVLEASLKTNELFAQMAGSPRHSSPAWKDPARMLPPWNSTHRLRMLPLSLRLALEMSLHEDDERRALEGELSGLENRWKEAEEIAGISDDMFLPVSVVDRLRALRG